MDDTAIVIVTYNSAAEIGPCVDAAILSGAEIIVVDNASSDGTLAAATRPGVRIVANTINAGFAAAVNQGFRATQAQYVLLLNPDAVLQSSLLPLREAFQIPGTGAAGGKLLGADGQPQTGFAVRRLPSPAALCFEALLVNRIWPANPVNWRFRCFDLDLNQPDPVSVEQPAGAFLMIVREAWQAVGGFDEVFHPLWFEDVDFCARILASGRKIFYVPAAVARHTGAHSIRKLAMEIKQIAWYGNLLKYASKHYPPASRRLVCCSVAAGSVFRSVADPRHVSVYRKVFRLAMKYFTVKQHRQSGPQGAAQSNDE